MNDTTSTKRTMTIDISAMKLPTTGHLAPAMESKQDAPPNPSIALFDACSILMHKVRIEVDRKALIYRVTQCEEIERAARRAHLAAEDDVKDAEEAFEKAERKLQRAKQAAQDRVELLHTAVTETDKTKRELSMINVELKKRNIEFEAKERVLGEAYKEAVTLSHLAMQAMSSPAMALAPTVRYPTVTCAADLLQSHHSVANPVLDPPTPTTAPNATPFEVVPKADDEPKKLTPDPEERSDKFIAALADLRIDSPGKVPFGGRTYFFVGDLTRIFSPNLKDPNKSGSAHARNYGTIDGGAHREGVKKQAGRWVMTLEAFEAYVLPHLRTVKFIKY